jgi:hypothetical protein
MEAKMRPKTALQRLVELSTVFESCTIRRNSSPKTIICIVHCINRLFALLRIYEELALSGERLESIVLTNIQFFVLN